jgi:hypothetical protein
MVGMSAHSLGISLRHILPFLRLPVVFCPRTVIDLRYSIHPNHPQTAFRQRLWRLNRRLTGSRYRSRNVQRSSRIPGLNPFMPATSSAPVRRTYICAILALPGRTRRRLRQGEIHRKHCYRNRHPTSPSLHKRSRNALMVSQPSKGYRLRPVPHPPNDVLSSPNSGIAIDHLPLLLSIPPR